MEKTDHLPQGKISRHGSPGGLAGLMPHIAPFAIFMAFIGIDEGIRLLDLDVRLPDTFFAWSYSVRLLATIAILIHYRRSYKECRSLTLPPVTLFWALFTGAGVFICWIHLPFTLPGVAMPSGYDPTLLKDNLRPLLLGLRILGAVVVVPIMEELFWRSFLARYLVSEDFLRVSLGSFSLFSFAVTSLLFGLEHHFFYAGVMAGVAYNGLLLLTRSLPACILAHGLTNLLLGIYVLKTQHWYFW